MKKVLTHCALLLLLCCATKSDATHLMGGNLSYSFVSFNPGNNTYTYSIELRIYRYCAMGSSGLDDTMFLGAYFENASLPLANKVLAQQSGIPLVSSQFINPPNPDPNCTFGSNVCVEEGVYRTNIVLGPSAGGYHLIVQRCCRNNNISNLQNPGGAGQVYYATIPPTTTRNSSPTFASIPVPFICAGDTTSILNAAFDVDGDSLAYSFVTPYNGTASSPFPIPSPPNPYIWPISNVVFDAAAGYSLTSPFGPGGHASISSTTGLASYMSPAQGFYVIAIEVREYRNGVLIGTMRRDLQIIVIPCPINNAPDFNGGPTTFTVQEGTNLCFPVAYLDVDGDSIFLTGISPIFDAAQTNPPATFVVSNGIGASTAQFCWATSCSQGRVSSYQFTVSALDDGCPAKTANIVYTINVEPTTISGLTGPDTICSGSTNTVMYSVDPGTFTYHWDVTGGSQVSGGNTATAGIQWSSGNGHVGVYAINTQGCHSDTLSKDVVASNPDANAGPNTNFCNGSGATLGAGAVAGQSYLWTPSTGLDNATLPNPTVTLVNSGTTPLTVNYVVTVSELGCSASDTVTVTVNPTPIVTANPLSALCVTSSPVQLSGTPSGGTFSGTGVSGSTFNPTVAGIGSHAVIYQYTDANGCAAADTLSVTVTGLPNVNAGINFSACVNAATVALSGSPSGGTFSGSGVSGNQFNSSVAGAGAHNIIYSYADSSGCGNTDTLVATVSALPSVNAGNDLTLCANAAPVALSGTPAGGTFSGAGVSNNSFHASIAGVGPHTVIYSYTDAKGCSNSDSTTFTVNALPSVNAGTYSSLCVNAAAITLNGTPAGGTFTGTGVTGSSFDPSLAGMGSHTITYAYTDSVGCAASGVTTILVNALPLVNAGLDFEACLNSSAVTLSGSPSGGTFTGTGVTTNSFNPSVSGSGSFTITYSYTDVNGCSASDTRTATVHALPVVTAGVINSLCTTSAPVTLTVGSPAGGTYSGTGVTNGIFNPAVSGAGTFPITYSYTDANGCNATATTSVTVFIQPVVSFTPLASTCVNTPPFALTGGSPAGGTYSGPGVSNGMFNPAAAGLGNHTITYTLTGSGGCTGATTTSIAVGSEPVVTVTVSAGIGCQSNTIYVGYGPQSLLVTATTTATGVSYSWYRDGILIPGATSSTLQVTVAGVYTVVVTDPFGCTSSPSNPASISTIYVVDVRCGHDLKKVVLCHVPPGNPGNPQTLCIAPSAVPAHLSNHPGDCLGPCPNLRVGSELYMENIHIHALPNPFSNRSVIEFTVFESSQVTIELYNIEGKLVTRLYDGFAQGDIQYEAEVNGENLSSGVYLVKATADGFSTFHKLVKTR